MLYDVFDCFPTLHSSHTRLRSANRKTRPSSQIRISDSETPNSLRSISESSGIADQDLVSSSANRKPSCTSSDISLVNQNLSKVEAVDEPPPVAAAIVIDSTTLGATKSTCSAVSEIVQKDNLIGDHKTKFDSANQKPSGKSDISLIDQIQKIKKVVAVSSSETSTSEIKATSTISSTSSSTNQKSSLKSSHSPLANNNTVVVEQHHQNNKIEEISTTESTVDTMLAKSDSGFSEKANTEEEEGEEYYDEDDDDDDFDPDLKTELSLDKAYQLFDKKIGAKFQNFNEDSDEEDDFENEIQSFKNKGDFFDKNIISCFCFFLFCHQLFVHIFSYDHSSGPDCLNKNVQPKGFLG